MTVQFVILICCACAVLGGVAGGVAGAVISLSQKNAALETLPPETVPSGGAGLAANNVLDDIGEPLVDPDYTEAAPWTTAAETAAETTVPPPTEPPATEAPPTEATTEAPKKITPVDIYNNCENSVVTITTSVSQSGLLGLLSGASIGSGFIISRDGYILTNYHVIADGKSYRVDLTDGSAYDAKLIGGDEANDFAVIKIESPTEEFTPVAIGDSGGLSVGDGVLIIGNPLGELNNTLTSGIVSALNRSIDTGAYTMNMFQTDAAINSGNSGGPVFDMNGEVVGIATAKYSSTAVEGLSFCIPINDILEYVGDIISVGYIKNRPLLGVSVQTVSASMAIRYGITEGAYIVAVGTGSAAQAADIRQGDVITEIDGKKVKDIRSIQEILADYKPEKTAAVKVFRSGAYFDLTVAFDEKKPAEKRTGYSNVVDI